MIRTVLKDIAVESLGWCQCHEHVFIEDGLSRMINESLYMNDYDKSLKEVFSYKAAGGHSFIDAQPYSCGRMAEYLIDLSNMTGVYIIGTTGFHKTQFLENPERFTNMSADDISKIYISEVEEGMISSKGDRLSGRAGIIKCAIIKEGIDDSKIYSKLFEAVAITAVETGAPIMVHTDKDADILAVIDYFKRKGIDSKKIMICHLDRARHDYAYHLEVAKTGVYLEYDTICREKYHSNEKELELISFMLSNGFEKKLMLSLDTTRQRLKSYEGKIGLDYILINFSKLLLLYMNSKTLNQLMIKNPSVYLNFC